MQRTQDTDAYLLMQARDTFNTTPGSLGQKLQACRPIAEKLLLNGHTKPEAVELIRLAVGAGQ